MPPPKKTFQKLNKMHIPSFDVSCCHFETLAHQRLAGHFTAQQPTLKEFFSRLALLLYVVEDRFGHHCDEIFRTLSVVKELKKF